MYDCALALYWHEGAVCTLLRGPHTPNWRSQESKAHEVACLRKLNASVRARATSLPQGAYARLYPVRTVRVESESGSES